jgi:hypothetical protein
MLEVVLADFGGMRVAVSRICVQPVDGRSG